MQAAVLVLSLATLLFPILYYYIFAPGDQPSPRTAAPPKAASKVREVAAHELAAAVAELEELAEACRYLDVGALLRGIELDAEAREALHHVLARDVVGDLGREDRH